MPRTQDRSKPRHAWRLLQCALVLLLLAASPAQAATPESTHARELAAIDSLIRGNGFVEAAHRIETAIVAPDGTACAPNT
ncbi:MAG: hypothetical protein KF797_09360 [Flavobacteriales bacterium]|nr:hypothetical protein [Flavobacteriales bacterium]